jgi:hypothetical protein
VTVDEYVKKIAEQITQSSSEEEALEVVEKAQRVIEKSDISNSSKKRFWVDLYESMGGDLTYTSESQDSAALSAIIDAAKAAIAQRVKK